MQLLLFICLISSVFSRPSDIVPNSSKNIHRLKNMGPDDLAEELSGQFEGDIILRKSERTGYISKARHWPNNRVPFQFNTTIYSTGQRALMKLAMDEINRLTDNCVEFVKYDRKKHKDYIVIESLEIACAAYVGRLGGRQSVNIFPFPIGKGCFTYGSITHELLHTLGLFHTQSSPDRDKYVEIKWENIYKKDQFNFLKANRNEASDFGVGYDYDSIMHYSRMAFSKNGRQTIIPFDPKALIGQRVRLSKKDILQIKKMYGCN